MAYEPGENGSQGLKRAKPIRDALCAILSRSSDDPLSDKPQNYAQTIALQLIKDANDQDAKIRIPSRNELMDRTEGKAPQAIIGGDENDPPLNHMLAIHDKDLIIRYLAQKEKL